LYTFSSYANVLNEGRSPIFVTICLNS